MALKPGAFLDFAGGDVYANSLKKPMIQRMSKIEILGDRDILVPVTRLLYELGVAHLEEAPVSEHLQREELSEEQRERERIVINALALLREMEKGLGTVEVLPEGVTPEGDPHRELEALKQEYDRLLHRLNTLEAEYRTLKDYARLLRAMEPLLQRVEGENLEILGVTLPRSEARLIDLIREALEERVGEGNFEIHRAEFGADRIVALLLLPPEQMEAFRKYLRQEGLSELVMPERYQDQPLPQVLRNIEADLERLPKDLQEAQEALEAFKRAHLEKIRALKTYFLDQYHLLRAVQAYPTLSKLLFFLRAWVPQREAQRVVQRLKKAFGRQVHVEVFEPAKHEYPRVPVNLENPRLFRPFQYLLSIFTPPIYGTIDPTPFLYLFFPFFFGFMLGDMGYGLVGTLLFGFLWLKSKPGGFMRGIATMFLWTMLWTLIFGFLYGEFFGEVGEIFGLHPILVHRTHEVRPVLVAAVAFGVVQVLLGLLLAVINQIRLGHRHHAWYEFARLVGLTGIVLFFVGPILFLIGGWQGWPQELVYLGIALLVIAIPAVVKLHNFVAPLELLSAVGNMFSYARLMAIGLASAILAMIANMFGHLIGIFIFGLMVALLFHALNTVLGIFDPTVQGLRLQFVEFFSKFYLTGGKRYTPFKRGGQ